MSHLAALVLAFIVGANVGGFTVWCIMDSANDRRWWREHAPENDESPRH